MDNHVGSFSLDEGIDQSGTRTEIIFDGDQIVKRESYDATALLKEAAEARAVTSGDRWKEGLGTRIGTVPIAELNRIKREFSGLEEQQKALLCWIRDNPKFVTFDKFLR